MGSGTQGLLWVPVLKGTLVIGSQQRRAHDERCVSPRHSPRGERCNRSRAAAARSPLVRQVAPCMAGWAQLCCIVARGTRPHLTVTSSFFSLKCLVVSSYAAKEAIDGTQDATRSATHNGRARCNVQRPNITRVRAAANRGTQASGSWLRGCGGRGSYSQPLANVGVLLVA